MSQSKPSFFKRALKIFAWTVFAIVAIVVAVVAWLVWPQKVLKETEFLEANPRGLVLFKPDPLDPEFGKLLDQMIDSSGGKNPAAAKLAARMAPRAISPEIVVVSFYDERTGKEEIATAIQLKRFGNAISMIMNRLAAAGGDPDLKQAEKGAVRATARDGEGSVYIQKEGVVVSASDAAAGDLSFYLAGGGIDDARGKPTDREKALMRELATTRGQIRGYFSNTPGRLKNFLKLGVSKGWFSSKDVAPLTDETVDALEKTVLGLLFSGELQSGDVFEVKFQIMLENSDSAELVKTMVEREILPQLKATAPRAGFQVDRVSQFVTIAGKLPEFKERVLLPAFRGGRRK